MKDIKYVRVKVCQVQLPLCLPPEPQLQPHSTSYRARFRGNQAHRLRSAPGRRQLGRRLHQQGGVSVRQVSSFSALSV